MNGTGPSRERNRCYCFKLMPLAPYEFFFIGYEWSGEKHELHRFDWLY
ncbi:MAG TPA: hypothetical protein VM075_05720 [Anaerolineae bacterium]|nr:hypothetical protein [Anaerolineae bacterium]